MKNLFKIFTWSNWQDIEAGNLTSSAYLLQGRRRSNGKFQFRVRRSFNYYGRCITTEQIKSIK